MQITYDPTDPKDIAAMQAILAGLTTVNAETEEKPAPKKRTPRKKAEPKAEPAAEETTEEPVDPLEVPEKLKKTKPEPEPEEADDEDDDDEDEDDDDFDPMAEDDDDDDDDGGETVIDKAAMVAVITDLKTARGIKHVKALMKEYSASRFSQLDEADWPAFHASARELIDDTGNAKERAKQKRAATRKANKAK